MSSKLESQSLEFELFESQSQSHFSVSIETKLSLSLKIANDGVSDVVKSSLDPS